MSNEVIGFELLLRSVCAILAEPVSRIRSVRRNVRIQFRRAHAGQRAGFGDSGQGAVQILIRFGGPRFQGIEVGVVEDGPPLVGKRWRTCRCCAFFPSGLDRDRRPEVVRADGATGEHRCGNAKRNDVGSP